MNALYMIELRPDIRALLQFVKGQGLLYRNGDEDLGYGIHAWLHAAFGDLAPGPWRLLYDRRRPTRILGYAQYDAEELRQRVKEFAEPSVFAVCPDPDTLIAGKKMPLWQPGRRLAFEVQCCPVGRKAGSGVEKDLFLIRADEDPDQTLSRASVYTDWARERLERNDAAIVVGLDLVGFRLVRQLRQTRPVNGTRRRQHLVRPLALLRGQLEVRNPDGFTALLRTGLGRHRSFGYGMLLLRPAT